MSEATTPPPNGPDDGSAEFVVAARRVLDAGDGALDSAVVARLGAIRRAAIATMDVPVRAFARWIPASAAACTFLTVGLLAWSVRMPALPVYDDELARLAAQDLELLDNIEFVAWMVESGVTDAT